LRPQARALLQDAVHLVPKGLIDDGLVLAGIGRALVDGFAEVHPVVDQFVEEALVDRLSFSPICKNEPARSAARPPARSGASAQATSVSAKAALKTSLRTSCRLAFGPASSCTTSTAVARQSRA